MAGGLAKWLRHLNDLVVGETAAPACFARENTEGAGMPINDICIKLNG